MFKKRKGKHGFQERASTLTKFYELGINSQREVEETIKENPELIKDFVVSKVSRYSDVPKKAAEKRGDKLLDQYNKLKARNAKELSSSDPVIKKSLGRVRKQLRHLKTQSNLLRLSVNPTPKYAAMSEKRLSNFLNKAERVVDISKKVAGLGALAGLATTSYLGYKHFNKRNKNNEKTQNK